MPHPLLCSQTQTPIPARADLCDFPARRAARFPTVLASFLTRQQLRHTSYLPLAAEDNISIFSRFGICPLAFATSTSHGSDLLSPSFFDENPEATSATSSLGNAASPLVEQLPPDPHNIAATFSLLQFSLHDSIWLIPSSNQTKFLCAVSSTATTVLCLGIHLF